MILGLPPGRHPWLLLAAAVTALSGLLLLIANGHRRGRTATGRPPRSGRLILAAVLLTAATATVTTVLHIADLHRGPLPSLAHQSPADRAQTRQPSTELTVDLTVTGDPKPHGQGAGEDDALLTVEAVVDRVAAPGSPTPVATHTPVTVLVRARDATGWRQVLPSTRLAARVRVLPSSEDTADTAAVLLAEGAPRQLARPNLAQRLAGRLRAGLRAACEDLSPDARGLLPSLVVGDTSRLPDDLHEAFRTTDLTHLIAVSGANLAILMSVLLGAPGAAGTPERTGLAGLLGLPLRLTAVLGALLTAAFVTICRPDPSVLRAAATALIGLLAIATGRPRHAVPALSGAVLVLVLLDPYLSRSYGFVLSVLATTGVLTLSPRWAAALRRRGWPHHLAGAVAATASVQALCGPVTVLLAPRISLVAIPCNVLAELAVAPVTLLGLAALAADPISRQAARFLAELAALPAEWLAAVARRGAALPGAQLSWFAGLTGAALLALATVALCWAAPVIATALRLSSRRLRAVLATAAALALLAVLLRPSPLTRIATGWPPPGWRFAMCDIGQGDMTVLPVASAGDQESDAPTDTAVVIDAGPDPQEADACLRDLGITRIPLLIISHFHADHVEGLPGVLRGRTVGALETTTLDAPAAEQRRVLAWASADHLPLLRARCGEHRIAGPRLSWDVLWPDDRSQADALGPNNASVTLIASVGGPPRPLRIALLGDLESPAQAAVLGRFPLGRVDVLKVAHHGSANQDWALTAMLHPRLALISVGTGNPYGHPSARTVDQLHALGATVLRTDQSGDIAVLGAPETLSAATHPRPHPNGRGH